MKRLDIRTGYKTQTRAHKNGHCWPTPLSEICPKFLLPMIEAAEAAAFCPLFCSANVEVLTFAAARANSISSQVGGKKETEDPIISARLANNFLQDCREYGARGNFPEWLLVLVPTQPRATLDC